MSKTGDKFVELFRAEDPYNPFVGGNTSLFRVGKFVAKKTPKGYVWRENGFQHFAEPAYYEEAKNALEQRYLDVWMDH